MLLFLLALYHHIIDVNFHRMPDLFSKHPSIHPLISGPCILQAEWQYRVMIVGFRRNKWCFLLILNSQSNLMVPLESIQKTHMRVSISGVHQLINLRYRERIFQACSVQVGKIHTYPPFTILLLHYHGIGQPFQEKDFFYCPRFFQLLNFLLNSFNVLSSRPPRFLLFRWV